MINRAAIWIGAAVIMMAASFFLSSYEADIYRKLLLTITLAISYNFLFGIAGQIAFAHYTFYGIGAYSVVILTFQAGLPLPVAVVAGIGVCALVALIVAIPSTRLEGFYLALMTLALAQLFVVVLYEGGDLTGGQGGLTNYRLPELFGFEVKGPYYTIVIVLILLGTLGLLLRLDRSWFGRACRAVRDNSAAAEAMGVNVARIKILAFVITSTLAGIAGMAYAFVDNTVNPPVFGLESMFLLLFMIIIGGTGRHAGAIVGAVALGLAPYLLEPIVGHHHALVFGIFVVVSILFWRAGLIGIFDAIWNRVGRRGTTRAVEEAKP